MSDYYQTLCHRIVKTDVAIVTVEMASKTLTRAVQNKKVTFVGQLSAFGMSVFKAKFRQLSKTFYLQVVH